MSHTPEPWSAFNASWSETFITAPGFDHAICCLDINHATEESQEKDEEQMAANARRIVACVNAFAGSPTDAIEEISATGRSVAQLCAMYAKAKERRDELLSALETVNESAVCFAKNEYSISADAISKVENAIASAKGAAA